MIKVFIIDDDKLARKGLISIVPWEECGMEVVGEAANGEKGLEFLENNEVDLAVVDIAMPRMTGLQFIEKSRILYPDMQYIVLSFHEDFENVQSALRLGTLDYISKMRLDQQDCTSVFRHASEIIQQSKPRRMERQSDKENSSGSEWKELQNLWLEFYWLYSEEAYRDAREKTFKLNPQLNRLEHLLVRISDIIAKDYISAEIPEVPIIDSISCAMKWIINVKIVIEDAIEEKPDYSNTNLCMLHAVEYMKRNLSKDISINTVAQQVGLSRSYFASNFKKIVGITFNQYLRGERVKEAKRLIREKRTAPGDVGQLVGYEDEKYFAGIFTDIVGCSPAEFRKNCL